MLNKDRFQQRLEDIAKGERVRVLFNLLMETLGCDHKVTKGEVFQMIHNAMTKEQEALMEVSPSLQRAHKAATRKAKKESAFREPTKEDLVKSGEGGLRVDVHPDFKEL